MNARSFTKALIVLLAVPFSAVGGVWFLYLLGYNMSIALWVGLIALLGVDAETGVFMLLHPYVFYDQVKLEGCPRNLTELRSAILDGAVKLEPLRLRQDAVQLGPVRPLQSDP